MAILVNKQLKFNNVILDTSYARIEITLESSGMVMDILSKFYQNKDMYKNNCDVLIPPFSTFIKVPYQFSIDGDPILFSHNKYIEFLVEPMILNHELIYVGDLSIDKLLVDNNSNYKLASNAYIHEGIKDGTFTIDTNEENNVNNILNNTDVNNIFTIKKINSQYLIQQEMKKYPYLNSSDITIVDLD